MLIGDMNARVENSKTTNIVGTYGEATLHNNGKRNLQVLAHLINEK